MANETDFGFEECMDITRILMRAVGVWLLDDDVVWSTCKFLTLMLPLFFLNILPQMATDSRDSFSLMLDVITTVDINGFVGFFKTLILWYCRVEIKTLVVQIQRDWKTVSADEQRKVWSNARTIKWILRLFTVSSCGTIITYTVVNFIHYDSNIVQTNGTTFRPLYLKSYFPFQTHESSMYEIISIGQCVGATLSVICFAAYDELYVSSTLHYSEQLFNLKQQMHNLVGENWFTNNSVARCLRPVIQRHFVSYAYIIENSFNKTFLVQVFVLSIALCLQGYQFVMMGTGNALLIFPILFTAPNLGSIFPQIIRGESLSLLDVIYQIQWYELPAKDAIMIVIVMSRCIRLIELVIDKFSLHSFARIMKNFIKCLSELLAMKYKVAN